MHKLNGLALLEGCRKLEPGQKGLLVSGTVGPEVFRHSRVKPDRFLGKPYAAQQLVDLVEQILRRKINRTSIWDMRKVLNRTTILSYEKTFD